MLVIKWLVTYWNFEKWGIDLWFNTFFSKFRRLLYVNRQQIINSGPNDSHYFIKSFVLGYRCAMTCLLSGWIWGSNYLLNMPLMLRKYMQGWRFPKNILRRTAFLSSPVGTRQRCTVTWLTGNFAVGMPCLIFFVVLFIVFKFKVVNWL